MFHHTILRLMALFVSYLCVAQSAVACDQHAKQERVVHEPSIVEVGKMPGNTLVKPQVLEEKLSAAHSLQGINVLEFVLTNKIAGREPQDNVESFNQQANDKAYAFARLSAEKHAQVTFLWLHDGKEQTRFNTNVHASKKWRTFSAVKLHSGNWKVQLISNNEVLVEKSFIVK